MKAAQIVIGQTYEAKISGNLVPVRVHGTFEYRVGRTDHPSYRTGYLAVNTRTGRELRIKSATRFRWPIEATGAK